MSPRKRRYLRNVAAALALLLVAAWVVPSFLNAERYRPLLKAALEQALHRRITFGHISLHVFPQPGFTISNVVVGEAPAFGVEPFARVPDVDCELLWRSLWNSRMEFGTLRLHHPTIDLVRDAAGEWNVENLLLTSGIAKASYARASAASHLPGLRVEADDARFDFKLRQNKKPFAIVGSRAEIYIDFGSRRLSFRISGDPVRMDLELPTPGPVDLDGTWTPAAATGSALNATLRTQGALLYDWIPLVTGYNPGVYGLLGSNIHLTGTLRKIAFDGNARLSHLHRWEQLPPANDLPCELHFQGTLDRGQRKLTIEALNLTFAGSEARVEGSIEHLTSKPDFNLAVAFERSRVEDLLRLGRRLLGKRIAWDVTGNVEGKLKMHGPWAERRYEGTLAVRKVRLRTPSGDFPVSRISIRIARNRIRLLPARVRLASGVEVVAEGTVRGISPGNQKRRPAAKPRYDLTLYSHDVALAGLLKFGRALGLKGAGNIAAEGIGTFTLRATGEAWPLSKPNVTAQTTIRSARLVIPGLTQPLNIPLANIQVYARQIIVNPIVAVMGSSVFSGWLMHEGPSRQPWDFSLKANRLSVGQGAQWFEATESPAAASLLETLYGIGSLFGSRRPASSLLSRLNAQGHFATPVVRYRALALGDFKAKVEIHHRMIRVTDVRFEAGDGRGEGKLLVDFRQSPAQISAEVSTGGIRLATLTPYLPPALGSVRGLCSASGHLSARGLTGAEIASSLQGDATMKVERVDLGNFNPIRLLARQAGRDDFAAYPQPVIIPSAVAHLRIQDRQVTLEDFPVDVSGTEVELAGTCGFDRSTMLEVRADLSSPHTRWLRGQAAKGTLPQWADVHLAGTLGDLRIVPALRLSQKQP